MEAKHVQNASLLEKIHQLNILDMLQLRVEGECIII